MKKLYYIFILMFFISSCDDETKTSEDKFAKKIDFKKIGDSKIFPRIFNDNDFIDLELKSPLKDGKYIGIFYDSTIAFTGEFKENKPYGLFHFYNIDGKISSKELYENGIQKKRYYYYFDNGKLEQICGYKNERIDGEYKLYYENGKIKEFGQFIEGYAIGTWKEFYFDGKMKSLKYYTKSIGDKERKRIKSLENTMGINHLTFPVGTWLEYDSLGNLIYKTYHDDSFNIILEDEYYPSGNLHFSIHYKGEVPYMCSRNPGYRIRNGSAEEYFENGRAKIRGYFINNERNGEWKFYDIDGNIIKIERYRNDSLVMK